MKTSDYRTIPLCFKHHREYHNSGRKTFAKKYDLDYDYAIEELNRIYKERHGIDTLR